MLRLHSINFFKIVLKSFLKSFLKSIFQKSSIRFPLTQVSSTCERMLVYCEYGGLPFDCITKFNDIMTEDGLCCVFNAVHPKYLMKHENTGSDAFNVSQYSDALANQWTPESGFADQLLASDKNSYPLLGVGK